ncbi:MAG: hypothetical protein EOP04_22490 [Proteobacteria bacterium]|nr:MAG: hypothetical protein EOP04_22490 [Pseudomonadota bacterium]
MGLLKAEEGLVEVCGMRAKARDADWREKIGFVFQGQGFSSNLSVEKTWGYRFRNV